MDRIKKLVIQTIKTYQEKDMRVYAGYAALLTFTAIFPFLILLISIVNLIPGYSAKDVTDILCQILPNLESVQELIESIMTNLKSQTGGLLASVAAVTTLWSASKGVSAIQAGLNEMEASEPEYETREEKGKGFIIKTLRRLLFTLMLILLIPVVMIFKLIRNFLADIVCSVMSIDPEEYIATRQHIRSVFHLSSEVYILIAFIIILLFYAVLPRTRRTLKSQLPGAVFTSISWFVFNELFAFCIPRFYHKSNIYGSLATVFLVLLWLRAEASIFFAGGALNRTLEEEKTSEEISQNQERQ